ncbi:NAD(P)H-binding protein [Streptomyces sp. NPDC006458]|uniref:SDR family oxidoreductase n=1 Tax=Streptomyces sp. NPDC006458 TaxID=3154302 RepID=UPI0033A51E84
MKILITGATGRVGSHLVRQLAEHHHIAATGRTVHPRTQGRVTWHRADLADPQLWTALLDDVDAAFLFPAFGHTHHFIDAATEVGLQKLVLLSSAAVNDTQNSLIKTVHAEVEAQVEASGIPTVRVRPTVFMANDLAWLPAIRSGAPVPLAYPDASMPAVAEQDIAAVAATCLTQHVDRDTYELTGPQSLTQLERLAVLTKHTTGAPAFWTDITDNAERDGLPDMPGPPGEYLLRNLARSSHTPVPPTEDVHEVLGRAAIDYRVWATGAAA